MALGAYKSFVPDVSVSAAVALPVLYRSENLFTEKSVRFRFERSVVDRLGFGHFAVRPFQDLLRGSELDL